MIPDDHIKLRVNVLNQQTLDNSDAIAKGFHPFARLQHLTYCTVEREHTHVFASACVRKATWSAKPSHLSMAEVYERADSELLDVCKSVWEVAENNFKDEFHISVRIQRTTDSDWFYIDLILHSSIADHERFMMYAILGGIDALTIKAY